MHRANILIVEDEGIVAADLADLVRTMGHTVVGIAANDGQAMQLAVDTRPDLVLMDIRLKGATDGVELAGVMRTSLGLPVVYLTAYSDDATLERVGATQPYGYLLKPINEQELRAMIETVLVRSAKDSHRQRAERRRAATLDNVAQAVLAVAGTDVVCANAAAARLLGCDATAIEGRSLAALFGAAAPPDLEIGTAVRDLHLPDGAVRTVTVAVEECARIYPADPELLLTLTPAS